MPNKFTYETLKLLLTAQNGYRVALLAFIGLAVYLAPHFVDFLQSKKELEQKTEKMEEATKHAEKAADEAESADDKLERLIRTQDLFRDELEFQKKSNEISRGYIKNDYDLLKDIVERNGSVLREELDRLDTLNIRRFTSNPGVHYTLVDGVLTEVNLDTQKDKYYYLKDNKRIYP